MPRYLAILPPISIIYEADSDGLPVDIIRVYSPSVPDLHPIITPILTQLNSSWSELILSLPSSSIRPL